jgi:hypothetical protein
MLIISKTKKIAADSKPTKRKIPYFYLMNCKSANTSFSPSVHASTSLSIRLGEDFINQQSTAFDTRFKFTGKEKGSETGYSYPSTGSGRRFGARYCRSAFLY